MSGRFIALDGLDGTGKSTQCRLLADWLRGQGREVVTCRDPGGTPLGDALRPILLDHQHDMTPAAEAMLFMASRAELVARVNAASFSMNVSASETAVSCARTTSFD